MGRDQDGCYALIYIKNEIKSTVKVCSRTTWPIRLELGIQVYFSKDTLLTFDLYTQVSCSDPHGHLI